MLTRLVASKRAKTEAKEEIRSARRCSHLGTWRHLSRAESAAQRRRCDMFVENHAPGSRSSVRSDIFHLYAVPNFFGVRCYKYSAPDGASSLNTPAGTEAPRSFSSTLDPRPFASPSNQIKVNPTSREITVNVGLVGIFMGGGGASSIFNFQSFSMSNLQFIAPKPCEGGSTLFRPLPMRFCDGVVPANCADFGPWTLDLGLWTLDFGPWTL
jgi:hypothetical protein